MGALRYISEKPGARVLLASQRGTAQEKSKCLLYEFEDLIASVDDVDVITVGKRERRVSRIMAAADRRGLWPTRLIGAKGFPASRRYDLLFVVCNSPAELYRFAPLSSLLAAARVRVCFVEELWNAGLERRRGELAMLRCFDHLYVSMESSVEGLRGLTDRPCEFLAPSVDTKRLCPAGELVKPRIDIWAMGRRRAGLHEALREVARRTGRFYLYDTTGNDRVPDHRAHRTLFAELAQRTRYFCVDIAKSDVPWLTGGQEEIGARFYEGAATGTVMVGPIPSCEGYRKQFDWEEAVIPLPSTADEMIGLFDALDAESDRVERIRRRNVAESLRRHDGAYRWASVLARVGLGAREQLTARLDDLQQRARVFDPGGARPRDASGDRICTPVG
jgi:hypothetical protein